MKPTKIRFKALLQRFGSKGEKTGWTYFEVSAAEAQQLNPGVKKSFRVKGKIDATPIKMIALIPMGQGNFIIPVKADLRKLLGKKHGMHVDVELQIDKEEFKLDSDLLSCLEEDPAAKKVFYAMPASHHKYYSKWISDAKTEKTKADRIARCLNGFVKGYTFAEILKNRL